MQTGVRERDAVVRRQIAGRGVRDMRVLAAMRSVSREAFLSPASRGAAYADSPLVIGEGQTISQPYIVALMLEAAEVGPGDRLLEIGTGSGYAAAVAARLAASVDTIERHASLVRGATRALAAVGAHDVRVHLGDGTLGLPDAAPFDVILVAAAAHHGIPPALRAQLAIGGRLVIPVGDGDGQVLLKVVRTSADSFEEHPICDVRFVPLIDERP